MVKITVLKRKGKPHQNKQLERYLRADKDKSKHQDSNGLGMSPSWYERYLSQNKTLKSVAGYIEYI
jgi:hypothetical protein